MAQWHMKKQKVQTIRHTVPVARAIEEEREREKAHAAGRA